MQVGTNGGDEHPPGADPRLRVQVLGPLRVERGGEQLDLRGPRSRLLLAILVVAADQPVSYSRLVDDLYGDDPPATARKSIQVHVSNLRRELGEGVIVTNSDGYQLVTELVSIDASEFANEVDAAGALVETDPQVAGERLSAALARWAGMPFGDLAHEPAVRAEAVRLSEIRRRAAEMRIDADLRLGRHAQVIGELEVLTTDHPYSEGLRELQMLALYRSGRQAEALRVFARARALLADELGIEPGAGLRRLEQQILEQSQELDLDPVSSPAAAPTGLAHAIRGFELRERLGAGSVGTVYRAYQPSIGREVAVKVIRPEIANQPEFVKRFEAEAQFIARLDHPHVVPLLDYWRDPRGAYLVMAHLGGGSLARDLTRGSWSPPAVLRLLDQIGPALAYLHRHGMAHGALKPASVLLDGDANAYLADLGVGSIVVADHLTPSPYVAPEQLAGRRPDARTDQYCLALLIGETLSGQRPGTAEQGLLPGSDEVPAALRPVLERACAVDPADRFERVDDLLRAVRRAFGVEVLTSSTSVVASDVRNPFKGLRAFTEVDAGDFHGRDALVGELLDVVRDRAVTVVIGPSGSGKSSLVKAGLLPAVRRGELGRDVDWLVTDMFPGSHPFEELETSLHRVAVDRPVDRPVDRLAELEHDADGLVRVAKRILPGDGTALLLVIDQFEELFSLVTDEDVRSRFLDCLVAVATDPRGRVKVVATMRADFFDRPLRSPAFGEVLQRGLVQVAMPSNDSMAEAIAAPVRAAGLEFEPGLVPAIIADVAGQPGGLPLMQFALTELFDRREGRVLTMASYRAAGGVAGALARRAEQIYQDLAPAARRAARDVFLRLVAVTDDGDTGRRRIRRTELSSLPVDQGGLASVISEFGAFRLLSFDHDPVTRGPTVEVAHEALMDAWPRYREWIADHREDLVLAHRLEAAAREWADGDRDDGFLLRGGRFEQYSGWAATADLRLTRVEVDYLEASEALAATHERERLEGEQRDGALRRRSRLLLVSGVLAVVLAALVATTAVSWARAREEQRRAEDQALVAEEQRLAAEEQRLAAESLTREVALARRAQALAAESRSVLEADPRLAATLAIEAIRATAEVGTAEPQAVDALHFALQADGAAFPTSPEPQVALRPGDQGLQGVFVLPVADLVELAEGRHTRALTPAECNRYFDDACADRAVPLPADIQLVGGVDGYREFTDPIAPLTGARVTVGGWYPEATWGANAPAFDAVLDATGLNIEYQEVDIDRLAVDGIAELDLVLYTELSWMRWAAEQGALVELGFLDDADLDRRFGDAVASLGRLDGGGTFAVPRTLTSQSTVLYRRDLFDERGYEVPTSFEELVALSDRMVADGTAPWCFAGRWSGGRSGGFPVTDWVEAFVLSGAGPDVYEGWARGEVAFDSEPVREAFDRLGRLVFADGYVGAGARQIPAIDFYLPALTMTGSEPTCLMTLATSILLELVPRDALDQLDLFVLPTENGDGVERLVLGGNHWSATADTPENRAVIRALLSREHAQAATSLLSSIVPPDIGFRYAEGGDVYETAEPSRLQLRLIDLVHTAVREGRVVWDASDRMPLDVGREAFAFAPTTWFETGPAALDQLLVELDSARALATR